MILLCDKEAIRWGSSSAHHPNYPLQSNSDLVNHFRGAGPRWWKMLEEGHLSPPPSHSPFPWPIFLPLQQVSQFEAWSILSLSWHTVQVVVGKGRLPLPLMTSKEKVHSQEQKLSLSPIYNNCWYNAWQRISWDRWRQDFPWEYQYPHTELWSWPTLFTTPLYLQENWAVGRYPDLSHGLLLTWEVQLNGNLKD